MMCVMLGVLLTCVKCLGYVSAQTLMAEEGPYQTTILNTTSCMMAPSWFRSNISAYTSKGRSLIRGVLSITRDVKNLKFRVIQYYLNGKKIKLFDMKNLNCHNAIIKLILQTIAVPFNMQNCNIKAGTYEFRDLNMDAILHSVTQWMWYGASEFRLEAGIRNQPLLCLELYLQVQKSDAKAR